MKFRRVDAARVDVAPDTGRPDKLRPMRLAFLSLLLLPLCVQGAPKQRPWENAEVVKVDETEVQVEQDLYRSSAPIGSVGQPLPTGSETHRKKVYTYEFKTDQHHYQAKVEKKPIEGVQAKDKVRIAVQKDVLYIEMPDGKERKLDLVKPD